MSINAIPRISHSRRVRLAGFWLLMSAWSKLSGQGPPPYEATALTVNAHGRLEQSWTLGKAQLYGSLLGVEARIEIKNNSGRATRQAVFYGEYYNSARSLCFTALFSQSHNLAGATGPFEPGEVRTLVSSSPALGLAGEPEELDLYLVRQRPVDGAESPTSDGASVLTPVAVGGMALRPGWDWYKTCLSAEDQTTREPVVDLALARATVSAKGKLEKAEVLDALSPRYEAWVLEFLKHLHFVPRTRAGVPESGSTLLLARAIVDMDRIHISPFPPAASPWVADYASRATGVEIPLVNIVLLEPPLVGKPPGQSGGPPHQDLSSSACVQYYGQGSDWSLNVVREVGSSAGDGEPDPYRGR